MGLRYMLENSEIYHFDSELCCSYRDDYQSKKLTACCVSD